MLPGDMATGIGFSRNTWLRVKHTSAPPVTGFRNKFRDVLHPPKHEQLGGYDEIDFKPMVSFLHKNNVVETAEATGLYPDVAVCKCANHEIYQPKGPEIKRAVTTETTYHPLTGTSLHIAATVDRNIASKVAGYSRLNHLKKVLLKSLEEIETQLKAAIEPSEATTTDPEFIEKATSKYHHLQGIDTYLETMEKDMKAVLHVAFPELSV